VVWNSTLVKYLASFIGLLTSSGVLCRVVVESAVFEVEREVSREDRAVSRSAKSIYYTILPTPNILDSCLSEASLEAPAVST